jgi:hypothetical protein
MQPLVLPHNARLVRLSFSYILAITFRLFRGMGCATLAFSTSVHILDRFGLRSADLAIDLSDSVCIFICIIVIVIVIINFSFFASFGPSFVLRRAAIVSALIGIAIRGAAGFPLNFDLYGILQTKATTQPFRPPKKRNSNPKGPRTMHAHVPNS